MSSDVPKSSLCTSGRTESYQSWTCPAVTEWTPFAIGSWQTSLSKPRPPHRHDSHAHCQPATPRLATAKAQLRGRVSAHPGNRGRAKCTRMPWWCLCHGQNCTLNLTQTPISTSEHEKSLVTQLNLHRPKTATSPQSRALLG
jgi:hypothetical protein